MNYFSHGYRYTDRPYFLAGTAVPDALSAINRRVRVRRKKTMEFVDDVDPVVADVAAGIIQHLDDDKWFHSNPVFIELSLAFAQEIRELLEDQRGTRAGFLGHIIVELILDAILIERQDSGADDYYRAVAAVDAKLLQNVVNRIATRTTEKLDGFIGMFLKSRFLEDYVDDKLLLKRLNQVMSRIGLEQIPDVILGWFPSARERVQARFDDFLPPAK